MLSMKEDVYKIWTGVHGPPHGPGPWTTMDHPMDLDQVHGPPLIFKRKSPLSILYENLPKVRV